MSKEVLFEVWNQPDSELLAGTEIFLGLGIVSIDELGLNESQRLIGKAILRFKTQSLDVDHLKTSRSCVYSSPSEKALLPIKHTLSECSSSFLRIFLETALPP